MGVLTAAVSGGAAVMGPSGVVLLVWCRPCHGLGGRLSGLVQHAHALIQRAWHIGLVLMRVPFACAFEESSSGRLVVGAGWWSCAAAADVPAS